MKAGVHARTRSRCAEKSDVMEISNPRTGRERSFSERQPHSVWGEMCAAGAKSPLSLQLFAHRRRSDPQTQSATTAEVMAPGPVVRMNASSEARQHRQREASPDSICVTYLHSNPLITHVTDENGRKKAKGMRLLQTDKVSRRVRGMAYRTYGKLAPIRRWVAIGARLGFAGEKWGLLHIRGMYP